MSVVAQHTGSSSNESSYGIIVVQQLENSTATGTGIYDRQQVGAAVQPGVVRTMVRYVIIASARHILPVRTQYAA